MPNQLQAVKIPRKRSCSSKFFAGNLMAKYDTDFAGVVLAYACKFLLCFCFIQRSPCVSKPIKQRVEAFEKLQTPQKETRKARVLNENDVRFF